MERPDSTMPWRGAVEAGEGCGEGFGGVGDALVELHVTGPGIQDSDGCILLMSIQTDVVHDAVSLLD